MKYRTAALDYDTNLVGDESGLDCSSDKGRTQQHFKEEVNINTIVKRFGLSGQLPQGVRVPLEADFVDIVDYHSAMNAIRKAQESFMAMPAEVRGRFDHDPGKFVQFCENPDNLDEMRKLGLAVPKAPEPPVEPPKAPEPAPAG